MVRNYRKKGDGPKWTKEDMGKAIDDVKNKKMSIYAAAKVNGVPKTTLLRHLKHPNKTFIVGRPTTLTSAQEDEIVETCQIFAEWGFGLTKKDIIADYFRHTRIPNCFCTRQRLVDIIY